MRFEFSCKIALNIQIFDGAKINCKIATCQFSAVSYQISTLDLNGSVVFTGQFLANQLNVLALASTFRVWGAFLPGLATATNDNAAKATTRIDLTVFIVLEWFVFGLKMVLMNF